MLVLLLSLFALLFGVLSYRHMDWAVYAVVALLPTYLIRFSIVGIPMTLLELMILVLFGIWIVLYIRHPKKHVWLRTLQPVQWGIVVFVVGATIGLFVSPELRSALGIWKAYIIEPLLFLVVLVDTMRTQKQYIGVLWALAASMIIPAIYALYQQITGMGIPNSFWQAAATRRVTSFYGYPNAIGLYFAPIVTGAIGMIAHKIISLRHNTLHAKERARQWWKLPLFIMLLGISALSIVFARSKGAILGIGIGLTSYAVFWKPYRKYFIGLFVGAFLIIAVSMPSLLSLQGTSNVAGGGSVDIRVMQWHETARLLTDHPIIGAGLAGYQIKIAAYHSESYIETFLYPHNIVLNFWVETGLLGMMAIVWVIITSIILGVRTIQKIDMRERHLVMAVFGGFITILAHGLVDVPFFKNDLAVLFWVFVGLLLIASVRVKELNRR